jgi:hypothetical protein
MTKIQRLEERVRQDDKMCAGINEALKRLDSPSFKNQFEQPSSAYAYVTGEIQYFLRAAGRLEGAGADGTEKAAG